MMSEKGRHTKTVDRQTGFPLIRKATTIPKMIGKIAARAAAQGAKKERIMETRLTPRRSNRPAPKHTGQFA